MTRRIALLALVMSLAGCGTSGRSNERQDRFVGAGKPRTSPSGQFVASVKDGPEQNGVATWIVVIATSSGSVVFQDDQAYSRRHGVGVTWLSNRDQLWILSSDVGTAHVDQVGGATWVKTRITPDTANTVPEEIARLK
jgi:hypothetical protein